MKRRPPLPIVTAVLELYRYDRFTQWDQESWWESECPSVAICDRILRDLIEIPKTAKRLHMSLYATKPRARNNVLCLRRAEPALRFLYCDERPIFFTVRTSATIRHYLAPIDTDTCYVSVEYE